MKEYGGYLPLEIVEKMNIIEKIMVIQCGESIVEDQQLLQH